MTDPIVTADWLARNLSQTIVLDATYLMPADPVRCLADYRGAHIPGARFFAVDEIAASGVSLPHMLPDPETFGAAMARLGIAPGDRVVVYDRSKNHFSAPRVWLTLVLYGFDKVHVLDGGFDAWTRAGHAVAKGVEPWEPQVLQSWDLQSDRVIDGETLKAQIDATGPLILDARSQERFNGTAPEPRAGLKSGHMRGSTCVPFTSLTRSDGMFATRDELYDIFGDLGDTTPIVSCGSGMTACVLALGLARIGRASCLYDGSWAEWGKGELGEILPS
jgi:thiosulfate/3-mercaptopyruvate sulfurtransferase